PPVRLNPGLPAELERIILKAVEKDPKLRYQTAADLEADLRRLRRDSDSGRSAVASAPAVAEPSPAPASAPVPAAATSASRSAISTTAARLLPTRRSRAIAALVFAVAIAAASLLPLRKSQALSARDELLIADFTNTTGDAVFDGTLRQALAVQLGQSPFLNVVSDERIRQTLGLMGRPAEERLTPAVGREVCEREGIKALLTGSIAPLGSHYVLTLEALNARSGEPFAREQAEAESKEQVLKSLGQATSRLRGKLGESLSTLKAYDTPVEKATTSSLEALKSFSTAETLRSTKGEFEALPHLRRAVELDPNFAMAWAKLGTVHWNTGERERSIEYTKRAFELKDRVSERERFYIAVRHYGIVSLDIEKRTEVLELWARTYPRDPVVYNYLAGTHRAMGHYDRAMQAAREELALDKSAYSYASVIGAYLNLGKIEEAKSTLAAAFNDRIDTPDMHWFLFTFAFLEGDAEGMRRQVEWAHGNPAEDFFRSSEASLAAWQGRLRRFRELQAEAVGMVERAGRKGTAAGYLLSAAAVEASVGNAGLARARLEAGLALDRGAESLAAAATIFALAGAPEKAQPFVEELARRFPSATFVQGIDLPVARAAIELNRRNPAGAVELLGPAAPYELGERAGHWVVYLRGHALLDLRRGSEAAQEFQKVLGRRYVDPLSIFWPLSHLGLARAHALAGDTAKSRRAYQDFFAFWKDADPDVPILIEARREYEKLKES
ncbi:MAG TPA: hypothetical protein VFM88_02570, partial [Vicinamibacteria bacterium]|nr:hypothetical protein [Vicinamibacteria bacterium]